MDQLGEIKKLYYGATKATIAKDLARAVELLKSMPSDDARQDAAVYMDGLSQMRSEWMADGGSGRPPRRRG
jgi:hypothetical protein